MLPYKPIKNKGVYTSLSWSWVAWRHCLTCYPPQLVLTVEHKKLHQSETRHIAKARLTGGTSSSPRGVEKIKRIIDIKQQEKAARPVNPRRGVSIRTGKRTTDYEHATTSSLKNSSTVSRPGDQAGKKEDCREHSKCPAKAYWWEIEERTKKSAPTSVQASSVTAGRVPSFVALAQQI